MTLSRQQQDQAVDWLRDLFDRDLTKLLLSVLIILSVLPFPWVSDFSMVFFGLFAVELGLRVHILRHELRHRSLNRVEVVFLVLDILATLSFLPIEAVWNDIRYLRLVRLSRMVLLLGYWGPIVREIWFILMKRERRYQIFFVIASALILSFISAILLHHFQSSGLDLNEDGNPHNDHSFWSLLWWSFRQIQDPGNLLKDVQATIAFFFSLFLTIAGMFIFSFLIGIGTSVVEELVALGKERRLGMQNHSVICNASSYSRVLFEELITYYTKSFRSPRIVAMGDRATRYPYMLERPVQRVRYRQGRPISAHDLRRVDADRATRVILLGQGDDPSSDSEVVSQILSVREVNPQCDIHAELFRPDNIRAALAAGGPDTVPILADHMVGLFLANITVFPGIEEIYWELLTSRGDEIYTCLYGRGALAGRSPPSGRLMPFDELLWRCHRAHGVILLGYLERTAGRGDGRLENNGFVHVLNPGSPRGSEPGPPAVASVDRLAGFFGVADNFQRLRGFLDSLPDVTAASPPRELERPIRFGLCPSASSIDRILICGFHSSLVDFCEQLILFSGKVRIYILLPGDKDLQQAMEVFVQRFDDPEMLPRISSREVVFHADGPRSVRYTVSGEAPMEGQIQFSTGDWTDEEVLISPPGLDLTLDQADAVFFTYQRGIPDPDARTALGLIKLIRLGKSDGARLKPGLRIVCEVQSGEKAQLFRRRFVRAPRGVSESCLPVTVIPAERLRNSVVAQAVFVPGISGIYRELLCETRQELCKLLVSPPEDPEATLSFGRLLRHVYSHHGLILLGLELRDEQTGERRVVINPRHRDPDYRFKAGQLRSLFAIGDKSGIPRASGPCESCPGRE